jgi:hypothetical protein
MTDVKQTKQEDLKNSKHVVYAGTHRQKLNKEPNPEDHREHIEPWLSALLQAENLNLLVGSGLTAAMANLAGAPSVDMSTPDLNCDYADTVMKAARKSAEQLGRESPNIEDVVRAALELIGGLRIIADNAESGRGADRLSSKAKGLFQVWEQCLDDILTSFLKKVIATERGIHEAFVEQETPELANRLRRLLGGFLLPFASRTGTRERLHIFTTNYDRLIEFGCDLLGLRVLDRFVGNLLPVFRSSRLGVDLHYNPPGIRGEPRYLEGVVRLTKLHGSMDWRRQVGSSGLMEIHRCGVPFGAPDDHPELPQRPIDQLLIYPNPAKDVETLEYPYAELFRDFAAACCQPNTVMITYGYGFGDDHVNRVLRDMLTIPSTHLVMISYDWAAGRVSNFFDQVAREEQITLLIGPHFGNLEVLVEHYLPKPAIDWTTWQMVQLLNRRARPQNDGADRAEEGNHGGRKGQ